MSSALRLRLPALGAGLAATAGALLLATGSGKRLMSTHTPSTTAAETPSGSAPHCDCQPLWDCAVAKCNGQMPCTPCAELDTQLRACMARSKTPTTWG
mmetsp:Transcript_57019/g.135416  ORF Transcript_57019/g.135416 Transcript_57019/m.135416 type:complete len:98 (-) Transcript_57019:194-487(-)